MEIAIAVGAYLLGIPIAAVIFNSLWYERIGEEMVGFLAILWPVLLFGCAIWFPFLALNWVAVRVSRLVGKIARPKGR